MTLPLNPDILAAAYDFLAATEPFRRWNLPDSDDVKFRVVRSKWVFGRYVWDGTHAIEMSSSSIGQTDTLMRFMAHEIIHVHLRLTGMESKSKDPNVHNAAFRKLAARVCATHGWDLKAFY